MLLEISKEECQAIYQKIQAIKDPDLQEKYKTKILNTWEACSFVYTLVCIDKDWDYMESCNKKLLDDKNLAFDIKSPSSVKKYYKRDFSE